LQGALDFSFNRLLIAAFALSMMLAGCRNAAEPTPTPSPTASPTSRPTASPTDTPQPSPSSSPTDTLTPSPTPTATKTPTPTFTPTVFGIVRSQQRVNVRSGPGVNFEVYDSLVPGTGVQVIGQDDDGNWYNIRLENEDEGWVSASLLLLEDAATASPAAAPASTASGTSGGATSADTPAPQAAATDDEFLVFNVPVVDIDAIHLTATMLVSHPSATAAVTDAEQSAGPLPPSGEDSDEGIEAPTRPANAIRQGVDVFAFCDDSAYGFPPPTDLAAGSTIEIFWAWFASTEAYLRQHIANARHELRVNDVRIANVDQFRHPSLTRGRDRVVHWYVPFGPLEAGEYRITYRVTWETVISDGYDSFGPGTATEFEEESCGFAVR